MEVSRKARERKGKEPTKTEEYQKVSSTGSSNLLGANSPEELGEILLQAPKSNDAKTWMQYMHPDNEKEDDELSQCVAFYCIDNTYPKEEFPIGLPLFTVE